MFAGTNAIWAQVLRAKYLKTQDMMATTAKGGDLSLWKGVLRSFGHIKSGYGPAGLEVVTSHLRIWQGTGDGVPTTKSFFRFITNSELAGTPSDWQWIWKLNCPQRLRFFMWMVVHDRLLTNSYREHIGFADSSLCPRCNDQP